MEGAPETLPILPSARTANFNNVTALGNKCAAQLARVGTDDTAALANKIKEVMPELMQMVVSVVFEKAKIWPTIETDPHLQYFNNMHYDAWLNPGDLNAAEIEKAKVFLTVRQG